MQMTPEEICRHYGQASNKAKDIKILAELNGTDPASIRAILIDGGILPADPPRRKRRPRTEKPAEETSAQAAAELSPPDASAQCRAEETVKVTGQIGPAEEQGPVSAPTIYQRVERILGALPAEAGQATRTRAYNLVMALLAEDIAGRLELERVTEGGEADG